MAPGHCHVKNIIFKNEIKAATASPGAQSGSSPSKSQLLLLQTFYGHNREKGVPWVEY